MFKKIIVRTIELYQRTLSPDHGWRKGLYPVGYCRYTPSCSQYFKEAVIKKGALRGSVLGIWRIIRCNPWSKGGHDPV
ncbi:MAG: membrane protein insertion efficiency factor YidD [Patescibacteria group bacterium]